MPDMEDFTGLLRFLGWDANEWMQYGFRDEQGKRGWYRQKVPKAIVHIANTLEVNPYLDMWFGINPVCEGYGRASNTDVTRILTSYLDLDFKPDGLGTEKNAVQLVGRILETIRSEFVALVHTGGGLQAYFPISDRKTTDIIGSWLTIKRMELLAKTIAHEEGLGKIDSVAQPTRIFRVPGSRNQKYADKPEVFRVYGVVVSEQEDNVKWLRQSDMPTVEVDQNSSEI